MINERPLFPLMVAYQQIIVTLRTISGAVVGIGVDIGVNGRSA